MTISFGALHRMQGVPDMDLSTSRILIVDDEPINVRLMTRVLEQAGFTHVRGTTDPVEGLDIYKQTPQDLVILDLRMPRMSGLQVLAELKKLEQRSYAPVLVMTAEDDPAVRLEVLQAGARDFVGKPFNAHEVLSRICNQLEVRYLYNRLVSHNATLEQSVQTRTRELAEARMEEMRLLVQAAEYRDNETGLHLVRMSKLSAALARQCGLSRSVCDDILLASPMHDIGKIGMPDAILRKPGPLDATEWETMRMHPIIGAEILSGHASGLLHMAHDIALCHHEKWDGSGYPRGLAGTDIPLAARIVAVADVFDALTSDRPYKKAWPIPMALAELDRLAGVHLDPALVASFHHILPEVEVILEQYAEPEGGADIQQVHASK